MAAERRAAGVVLYRRDGPGGAARFLLLETAGDGHWSPPKGHLDEGETDLEAALRETREEAGLAPRALDEGFREEIHYQVITKRGHRAEKTVVYFLGEAAPGDVRLSHEHTASRWATIEEARGMIPFENLRGVIEKAAERLTSSAA